VDTLRFTAAGAANSGATSVVTLNVSGGTWGDANFSWRDTPGDAAITASDVLVCLSRVVQLVMPSTDPAACDVAPDAPGSAYSGVITAKDAQAIMSFIIGRDVSMLRVGVNR
jgi:hypothetical protein